MQHPDEGMIHSWLDGALSAEEAARVESHVSDCASCAAAVAEARGFIAGSSRILTALDDVPRGVLPAVPGKRRDFRIAWRAAAAMLIVAGGSLVVMRDGGPDATRVASEAVKTTAADQATVAPTAPPLATDTAAMPGDAKPLAGTDVAKSRAAPVIPPVAPERRAEAFRQSGVSKGTDTERAKASVGEVTGATGAAAAATAPNALQMQMNAAPERDPGLLKVVQVERTPSSRRTIYQVTPSETVTLTEPAGDSTTATGIVLRGSAGAARQTGSRANRTAAPMSAEAAKAPPPPPPPSPTMDSKAGARFTTATNTITWTEPRTEKTLTLSGNVSVERLQEIRKLIERQRASAGGTLP